MRMIDADELHAISTHALREEGDDVVTARRLYGNISTHALREEGDPNFLQSGIDILIFLPTPSARRATVPDRPRIPAAPISTHALREEGDNALPTAFSKT